ncbi:MAG: NADH-ubiquinone/plastoquinone oxidoreductase subunit 6 [Acidobacteria bacterium RIFCSPLOWO2_12_FULL_54_10]|nr:MAG: NADH-ubiquinone/plastoquinone oxidoreductase subunit 6 [Acidobacteria bacterium RIFCSPLOWO2_12_FULL_54_10]
MPESILNGLFFYVLAVVILGGAIMTITRRNAVHSAIWLVVTLMGVAGLYLHLNAEFLAAVQILVYIGGIMVLFLFVIMLVNLDEAAKQRQFNRQWSLALICTLVVLVEFGFFLMRGAGSFAFAEPGQGALKPNTELMAVALFQDYLLPFEIASLLLLVAILGAVLMAKKEI